MSDFDLDGGVGDVFSFSSLDNSDGNGQAQSSLSGPTALPVLSIDAFSGPDSRVGSDATGVREYNYSGPATSITLDVTLDGEAGAPVPNDAFLEANIAVIKGTDLPFTTDFATLIFEIVPGTPGLELVDTLSLDFFGLINAGPQTLTGSLAVPLEDGDNYFVWAGLEGSGTRGGFADAANTLTMSFSNDTGITVVPEPSTLLMVLGGLGVLSGARGRRHGFRRD